MKSLQSNQARKRAANLTLNEELVSQAKGMTTNLSGVVRQEIARCAEVAAQAWNSFNERSGSFADEHSTL